MKQSRREFLELFSKTAGCSLATASLLPLASCSLPRSGASAYRFPQGVASADPQPDGIVLWTRVVSENVKTEAIELRVQLARDEDFSGVQLDQLVLAEKDLDFTVRCFVDGLEPDGHYFYRFIAPDGGVSRLGRTRTAPTEDAETTLTVAVCSCQNYELGLFSAYRRMLLDDQQIPGAPKIDVVVHVGDFIYESVNRQATDPNDQAVELKNVDGSLRRIVALPSKGPTQGEGRLAAETLEDYRELYRVYLSDPDLQDARAALPFIYTWDDHEFFNDYWQSFHPSGPMQRRKVTSNQAWFEYMPAALTRAPAGPAGSNPARDFSTAEVDDTPPGDFDENYLSREPNNLAAIGSLPIHRSLRWGRVAELFVVDGRSYRGPRGLDSSILGSGTTSSPDAPVPTQLIEVQNAGRTANNHNPPDTVEFQGAVLPNSRKDAPRGSMLGAEQKAWLKESLEKTQAHWKVLCNNVPMMRFGFDVSFREHGNVNDIWWTDSWDGYPVERRELMNFIRDHGLENVVSLAGDRHAHFAGVVYDDFDGADPRAVIAEFTGTGISAGPRLKNQRNTSRRDPELDALVHFDGTRFGYDRVVMPALNAWLLFGAESAAKLGETGDAEAAIEVANSAVNPHLRYSDTDALGFFVARFSTDQLEVEFVVIVEPIEDFGESGPPVRRRVRFRLPAWSAGEEPKLATNGMEGKPPLMGLKT